ncbi:hypothetical protein [Streptomyces viridosporus]|uniref:hypothetical protein n=1 Tax=Streptomyces viridosporus TaxID=67581 RepID=UPI0001AF1705|nr:hypothetical protein [Streptomyces viridosporus]
MNAFGTARAKPMRVLSVAVLSFVRPTTPQSRKTPDGVRSGADHGSIRPAPASARPP